MGDHTILSRNGHLMRKVETTGRPRFVLRRAGSAIEDLDKAVVIGCDRLEHQATKRTDARIE